MQWTLSENSNQFKCLKQERKRRPNAKAELLTEMNTKLPNIFIDKLGSPLVIPWFFAKHKSTAYYDRRE